MRIASIILLFFCGIGAFSCSKDDTPLFTLKLEGDFTIEPGRNSIDTHIFVVRDVPTNIQLYSTPESLIKVGSILAGKGLIRGIQTSNNYENIYNIEVNIYPSQGTTTPHEAFYLENRTNTNKSDLRLQSSLPNFIDLLSQPTVTLEFEIRFKNFTNDYMENHFELYFNAFESKN